MKNLLLKSLLAGLFVSIAGCQLTAEDRQQLEAAADDLERIASQIIITRPAKDSVVTTSKTLVLADVPADASVSSMSLFVDGTKVAEDNDGAPWEFSWDSYYWADNNKHSLFLKAMTGDGVEVRNNDPYQVTVSSAAVDGLSFADGVNNTQLKGIDSFQVRFKAVPNATGYELLLKSDKGGSQTIESNNTSVLLDKLAFGHYEMQYRAKWQLSGYETVVGPWSDTATFDVLDPNVFEKYFGGGGSEYGNKVIVARDGGYVVVAWTQPEGVAWVFKLDQQGNILWEYSHTREGAEHIIDIVELESGDFILAGYTPWSNVRGVLSKLSGADGTLLWDREYKKAGYDQSLYSGVAVLDGNVYAVAEDRMCVTTGGFTSCSTDVSVNKVDSLGEVVAAYPVTALEGAAMASVGSISLTRDNKLLLALTVVKNGCAEMSYACVGAGIALVSITGVVEWSWNSLNNSGFANGRYAAEIPGGGYVLTGQGIGMSPLAMFDVDGQHTGTYYYPGTYSNYPEVVAFSDGGEILRLVNASGSGYAKLIATGSDGNTSELLSFAALGQAMVGWLVSTPDNGLIMLFTKQQSGNYDLVVKRIGNVDLLQ